MSRSITDIEVYQQHFSRFFFLYYKHNFPGHIFRCAVSYGGLLACTAPNQPCTNAFGQFGIELTHSKEYGEILDPFAD
jgi:hypothetical protein